MPYILSQNYEQLYALLLQGEEVACWVVMNEERKICQWIKTNNLLKLRAGDYHIGLTIATNSNEALNVFLSECHRLSLSFIPQHDVGKIAGDAWEAALKWFTDDESAATHREQYIASLQPL